MGEPDPIERWTEYRAWVGDNPDDIACALEEGDALVAALRSERAENDATQDILGAAPAAEIIADLREQLETARRIHDEVFEAERDQLRATAQQRDNAQRALAELRQENAHLKAMLADRHKAVRVLRSDGTWESR